MDVGRLSWSFFFDVVYLILFVRCLSTFDRSDRYLVATGNEVVIECILGFGMVSTIILIPILYTVVDYFLL